MDLRILVQGAEFQVVDAKPPFNVLQAPHLDIAPLSMVYSRASSINAKLFTAAVVIWGFLLYKAT